MQLSANISSSGVAAAAAAAVGASSCQEWALQYRAPSSNTASGVAFQAATSAGSLVAIHGRNENRRVHNRLLLKTRTLYGRHMGVTDLRTFLSVATTSTLVPPYPAWELQHRDSNVLLENRDQKARDHRTFLSHTGEEQNQYHLPQPHITVHAALLGFLQVALPDLARFDLVLQTMHRQ